MMEQFEIKNGYVKVPVEAFNAMCARLEESADIRAYDRAMLAQEEAFPLEFAEKLMLGEESPLKLYRDYRDLTQEQLAEKAGCGKAMISRLENGTSEGSISLLKRIAAILDTDLDDLV